MSRKTCLAVGAMALATLAAPSTSPAADARTGLVAFQGQCDMSNGQSQNMGECTIAVPVPPNKRLVLETVTGQYTGDGTILGPAYLTVDRVRHSFAWVAGGESPGAEAQHRRSYFAFNHYVQIYVDGPAKLTFDTAGGSVLGGSASYYGWYTVSGYLVDKP